jgi:hypothetical protein
VDIFQNIVVTLRYSSYAYVCHQTDIARAHIHTETVSVVVGIVMEMELLGFNNQRGGSDRMNAVSRVSRRFG